MRTDIPDRYYRTLTYQSVDRVPDIEFGYWPQTIRRWLKEGLPLDLASESELMFSKRLDDYFGFEYRMVDLDIRTGMMPEFEEKIIERRGSSTIMRTTDGIIAERFTHDKDESSIPHFLEFPVKTPDDWQEMKLRYRPDSPERALDPQVIERARQANGAGKMVSIYATGPYGKLRDWMGFQNLSLAFYDYPDMIRDMVETWAGMMVGQINRLPADVQIDYVKWWEDMASKNGPFVSPAQFREFLQPCYKAVMGAVRKRGCVIAHVDCDGNPHDLVANWLEEGVNVMFPLEVAAGVDPYAWRREFGNQMRIRGAVAKRPLVIGGKAIDEELGRLRPLLEQGGFVPHLDHLVPPDISFDNYRYYLDKKRKLIGK